jgi:uncharacterized protein involved in exopolysaccharide biosynthesis
MPAPTPTNDALAFVLRAVWRRKLLIAAFAALAIAAAGVATKLSTPSYRSQAKLYVRLGRENATLEPTATLGHEPVVALPASRDAEVNAAQSLLSGQPLLEKVVERLGVGVLKGELPEPGAPPPESTPKQRYEVAREMGKRLNVEVVKRSNVLQVSYEGASPDAARAVVAELVDQYLEMHVRLNRGQGAYQFLVEQVERSRKGVEATEGRLAELKERTGVFVPEAQRLLMLTRIGKLEDDLMQAEAAGAAASAEVKVLQARLDRISPTQVTGKTGMPDQAADTLRTRLAELRVKHKGLAGRYSENHPDVRQVSREIREAEALLDAGQKDRKQVTEGPNRVHEEAVLALARQLPLFDGHKARAELLHRQVAGQRKALADLDRGGVEFARLQRDLDRETAQHRKYAESLEQAQLDRQMQASRLSSVSVAEPATWEPLPVRPSLLRNLALGLAFGLCGGLALALWRESADRGVRTPEQAAELLGMPALAALPRGNAPAAALAGGRVWAELRRTCPGGPRLLGVAGECGAEAAAVLARAATESGDGEILLVDAASPRSERPGLAEALKGTHPLDGVIENVTSGLHAVYPGATALEPDLLQRLPAVMQELGRRFAALVVALPAQTPPGVRRALALDGVVLVVRAGRTQPEAALACRQEWAAVGVKLLGVVLTEAGLSSASPEPVAARP